MDFVRLGPRSCRAHHGDGRRCRPPGLGPTAGSLLTSGLRTGPCGSTASGICLRARRMTFLPCARARSHGPRRGRDPERSFTPISADAAGETAALLALLPHRSPGQAGVLRDHHAAVPPHLRTRCPEVGVVGVALLLLRMPLDVLAGRGGRALRTAVHYGDVVIQRAGVPALSAVRRGMSSTRRRVPRTAAASTRSSGPCPNFFCHSTAKEAATATCTTNHSVGRPS